MGPEPPPLVPGLSPLLLDFPPLSALLRRQAARLGGSLCLGRPVMARLVWGQAAPRCIRLPLRLLLLLSPEAPLLIL